MPRIFMGRCRMVTAFGALMTNCEAHFFYMPDGAYGGSERKYYSIDCLQPVPRPCVFGRSK